MHDHNAAPEFPPRLQSVAIDWFVSDYDAYRLLMVISSNRVVYPRRLTIGH